MRVIQSRDRTSLQKLKARKIDLSSIVEEIRPILCDVKQRGDQALKEFAWKYDKKELKDILVGSMRRSSAVASIPKALRDALIVAKSNICKFHEAQLPQEWWIDIEEGIQAGQLVRPIEKVGCYVPGGRYPLVSTVLMTVLPAKIAGVKEIFVCTPKAVDEILAACDLVGVDKVFEIGGPAAIAAMSYGTETVPKVDKIVGPGNVYVTAAKKAVYGEVGIDFLAGPSEVVIIADENANATYIAADLLAQAEHDVAAQSLLITPSLELAKQVSFEIERMLTTLSSQETASSSLEQNGAIILVSSLEEAFEVSNFFAPEHLEIHLDDLGFLPLVQNAGSIFIGENSPEAAGDYASGPNHVLPTAGFAALQSGLSVRDFIKTPTIQKLSKKGLGKIASSVVTLAETEGLEAHAQSIKVRLATPANENVQAMQTVQPESTLKALQPKQSILQIPPYFNPAEGRRDYLRLDFNENTLGASPKAVEAIRKVGCEELSCYPEYENFNRALSQFLKVGNENVLPTNGTDEAIRSLFEIYVDKGDEVILLTPSYSLYEHFAQMVGAKMTWVPYLDDFCFPIEEILRAVNPSTRLIALASPNNPTGTLISRKEIQRIIEANPNMLVLIDEAYAPFAKMTNIDLIDQYSNLFITQTFSKVYGLAGLRIGALISSGPNIQVVSKILYPTYSVDCLAMVAAIAAMQDKPYYDRYVEEVITQRELFTKQMNALGFATCPSFANFILVNFGKLAEPLLAFLRQNKILVRPRSEKSLQGYLRISIGTKEQMQRLLDLVKFFCTADALIFDMDGVLIDESESYRRCIRKTVEYFSKSQVDLSLIESFKRRGGLNNDYDCTEAILSEMAIQVSIEEIIKRFDIYYEDLKSSERWLLNEKLLIKLKEKYRLGIFTGRPKKDAFDALIRFNKESIFEVVITDDDVEKRKPDPEGLILALQRLGVKKAIYLGDSKDDFEAAERACIDFIAVVAPNECNEKFKHLKIAALLEDVCEIEKVLC